MQSRRKPGIMPLIIILAISNLCGPLTSAEIKAAGKLLIPTANGEKLYKCVIVFTRTEIRLECDEKIFQSFNLFATPKQAAIKLSTTEIKRITLQGNWIVIFPEAPLCNRYRNLLNHVWLISLSKEWERLVFIFVVERDSRQNMGSNAIKLINLINERNDPECYECGLVTFY